MTRPKGSRRPVLSPRPATRATRGFSLVEMLVVLMIVVFASTVAILSYGNYRKTASVRGAAERVRSAIVEARTRAIANGQPTAIAFDIDRQAFWLDEVDSSNNVTKPKVIAPEFLGEDLLLQLLKVNGNTFASGIQRATFNPDGTNPFLTVQLRREFDDATANASYYSVQIYPNSGEARVWPNARR